MLQFDENLHHLPWDLVGKPGLMHVLPSKETITDLNPTFSRTFLLNYSDETTLYEPRSEKTNILHMRKQRRRSASR